MTDRDPLVEVVPHGDFEPGAASPARLGADLQDAAPDANRVVARDDARVLVMCGWRRSNLVEKFVAGNGGQCATATTAFLATMAMWFL
jgi:hypothetical protein